MVPASSRRDALAAVASLGAFPTAGCIGRLQSRYAYPHVTLRRDPVPVEYADVEATVVEQFTDDHPARVRVAFRNPTDETRTYGFSASPPFSGLYGSPPGVDGDDRLLVLVPLESEAYVTAYSETWGAERTPTAAIPDAPTDGCWHANGEISHHPIELGRTLDPGETLSETYAVLSARESDESGCEVVGEWRFESNSYFDGHDRWGFELVVE